MTVSNLDQHDSQARDRTQRTSTISWKEYFRVIFLLNPLICFIITWPLNGSDAFLLSFIFAFSISFITASLCIGFAALMEINTQVWRHFSPRKRNLLFQALAMGPALYLAFLITKVIFKETATSQIEIQFGHFFTQSLSFIALIMGIGYLLDLIKDLKLEKTEKELLLKKAELENLQIKMNTLTQQLSPHFIFNALNTLSSAIRVDPLVAERMSLDLADFFRTILEAIKKETHSIEQEIKFARSYLDIEKIRFGDRVSYQIHLSPHLDTQITIPVLILQPLIENALKHGLHRLKNGGTIKIHIHEVGQLLNFTITNTMATEPSRTGTNTGIENVEKRLHLFCRQPVLLNSIIENNEYKVHFSIPLDGPRV